MKKILITGASRGFGKLTVERLLDRGHEVLAALRGGEARGKTLFSPAQCQSGRLHFVDLHLDRVEQIDAAVTHAASLWNGSLDVLINNAGYGLMGPLEGQTDDQVRRQMEINFFAPLALSRRCIPLLRKNRGRIINLSSIAGLVALPFYGAYNASKFALEAVSEALAYELRDLGIQVALIEPGGFHTEFAESVEFGGPGDPRNVRKIALFQEKMNSRRQIFSGDPTHVADLLVRLCEKRRVPLRTIIGRDAKSLNVLKRLLPDSWRVYGVAKLFSVLK
ncbi:MAG: hypothetical protein RJB38_1097 [Pseudomonadota bacterium]|jgi:NAD(P)-dependent dehydrogenase (short-subunit alcohol dehydrogenase family)